MIVRQLGEIIGKVGEIFFLRCPGLGEIGAAATPAPERKKESGVSLSAPLKGGAEVLGGTARGDLRWDAWGLDG